MQTDESLEGPEFPQIGEEQEQEKFLGEYDTREDAEKALADLKAEREELRLKAEEVDRLRTQMDALMTRQPQYELPRYEAPTPEIDFPDPVTDPEGYKRAMKEFRKTVESDISAQKAEFERREQERESNAFAEKLWDDFKGRYSDLDDEVLVGAIATREAQAIRDAGGDPARYVRTNREQFMERVASGVRSHVARYKEKDTNRTAGIPGGTQSPSPRKQEPEVPSFIEQIKQARMQAEKAFT